MKRWSWILMAVMTVVTALAVTVASLEGSHRRSLAKQVKEQSVIIDSLLKRRMTVFDVQLHVTDKSVNKIYGRYNKGTISMPQERKYILEVDSVSMRVKN